MADVTTTTARLIGHMTYTQASAEHEKNILHLLHLTQPVKNYSCLLLTNKSKIKTKVTAKCFPVVSKLNLNYLLTTWKNS